MKIIESYIVSTWSSYQIIYQVQEYDKETNSTKAKYFQQGLNRLGEIGEEFALSLIEKGRKDAGFN